MTKKMTKIELQARSREIQGKLSDLNDKAYNEKRSFTEEEQREWNHLSREKALVDGELRDMLNERDREVLRLLVIEGFQMLTVAKELWKYVDSKQDISELSPKRIQGTISMIKHRAQLALLENLEKLSRS